MLGLQGVLVGWPHRPRGLHIPLSGFASALLTWHVIAFQVLAEGRDEPLLWHDPKFGFFKKSEWGRHFRHQKTEKCPKSRPQPFYLCPEQHYTASAQGGPWESAGERGGMGTETWASQLSPVTAEVSSVSSSVSQLPRKTANWQFGRKISQELRGIYTPCWGTNYCKTCVFLRRVSYSPAWQPWPAGSFNVPEKGGGAPLWTRVSRVIVHALKLLVGVGWLAAQMLHRHQLWSVSASSGSWSLLSSSPFPFFSSLLR